MGLPSANAHSEDGAPKARAAYQDFLALWKDADIPVLKQDKPEYGKLQQKSQ